MSRNRLHIIQAKKPKCREVQFKCFAYDDLQDDWHKAEGVRERIYAFAEEFGVDFRLASGGPFPFERHFFDMLMMNSVLEHLHDSPRDLLNDLMELVKPDGLFLTTVPNAVNIRKRIHVLLGKTNLPDFTFYYWYPGSWRGHIREYTKDDLFRLARYLNLETLELRSCHHMISKLPFIARPVYVAVTAVFTGWRDTWLLVARSLSERRFGVQASAGLGRK